MSIIAFCGHTNSGKDEAAKIFAARGFRHRSLAGPVKDIIGDIFGFTQDQLYGPSQSRNEIDERFNMQSTWYNVEARCERSQDYIARQLFPGEPMMQAAAKAALEVWIVAFQRRYPQDISPRMVLQSFGTEFGRRLDQDIWVNFLLREAAKDTLTVVSDVRFANEAKAVYNSGGAVIRISRKDTDHKATTVGIENHASEQLDIPNDFISGFITNDSTLEVFHEKIDHVYKAFIRTIDG